ncbi:MAG: (2Fe-2S)-binding protein [Planctomycetales bacterium]|nr:(2Fe-2S)-binding protein [Planctomycetales bacterium]
MHVDDELCLCFHVTWRKVINYARIHRVKVPSQLADCQSAGTGCGWCRAAMRRLVDRMQESAPNAEDIEQWLKQCYPRAENYADGRRQHIAEGKGQPPPLPPAER